MRTQESISAGQTLTLAASQALPIQDGRIMVDELQQQLPKFSLKVTALLENMYYFCHNVRRDLQDFRELMDNFSELLKACDIPALEQPKVAMPSPSISDDADQVVPELVPESEPSTPEAAQEVPFEAVARAKLLSDWPELAWAQDAPEKEEESGLEDDKLESHDLGTKAKDTNSPPQPPETSSSSEESPGTRASPGLSNETTRKVQRLLKLLSWDPEDFEGADRRCWRLGVPSRLEKKRTLRHGEPVLAVGVSSFTRHAFTCGRAGIKVWSLADLGVEARLPESCLFPPAQSCEAYLRTCLLTSNNRSLLAGGHSLPSVSLWDLAAPSLRISHQLPCEGYTCQALAANLDENLAFASFTDGTVRIWDLRSQSVVRDFHGPPHSAKSLVVKAQQVWTGGLDACLRGWDLRAPAQPLQWPMKSQIMSLAHCPNEDWVVLGLASGEQWLHPTNSGKTRLLGSQENPILGLKFSPFGRWWVSVDTDGLVSICSMPLGAKVVQVPENSSAMCCDVCSNSSLVAAGTGDCASVYQVAY
ncbi:transducin-like enhancer protein 6 [Ochotona curzoniae]|uniref:transducin-like enhancer protein 6 n=1 Tax=Ochotona curzoniae TaxID=130825 RepID=UPI001B34C9A9|nr:transducin-like enhancer protein 6 [Ochotona curzoniae]